MSELELDLGPIRLRVEHREVGPDGGPALRVCAADGTELLRFDCFARGAHYHVAPSGADVVTRIDPYVDPVSWTLDELRRDLAGHLERAGAPAGTAPDREALRASLARVEAEMRNPPVDFDGVDLARLRASPGEKWRLYPDDVLPAWVADMDFPVAEPVRLALRRAVERSHLGYPVNPRPQDLPSVFAQRMRERFGWEVSPRRVEVICDVVQGVYVGLLTLCEEGEGAVVQTPIYPPFLGALRETRRRLVENPLVAASGSGRFELDLDGLRAAVDAGTRVLLLCSPHNPTGRVFTRAELEALAELALERDLVVISDEIHADLVLPGEAGDDAGGRPTHIPFATLSPEVEARTVTLMSATKAFNLAGLRCAVAAFGSADLRRRFLAIPRHVRGGVNALGLLGTEAAWRHAQPWLDRVLGYLRGNRDHLVSELARRLPEIRTIAPEATYLAWLDCGGLGLGKPPADFFLERARVALSDGRHFGTPGEGHVRLNFATPRAVLDEILGRMERAVRE